MITVDTNVVVRLLTQDDDEQYQKSVALFQSEKAIFIPITVLLETEWVLRFAYKIDPFQICEGLRSLLGLPNVQFTQAHQVQLAIEWHEQGLDFADALHLAQSHSCRALYSFDQRFIKRAKNVVATCEVKHLP